MSLRGRSGLLPKWLNSMLNNTYLNSVDKLLLAGESFKDFLRNDYCLPYFLLFRRKVALFARNLHGFNLRWNCTAVWGICEVS